MATAMAVPSHSEGSPNVVLEAMAAGLPIAANAVGGVPEILEENVTGLMVPPHNPEAMAKVLVRILSDAELRAGWARRRERALNPVTLLRLIGGRWWSSTRRRWKAYLAEGCGAAVGAPTAKHQRKIQRPPEQSGGPDKVLCGASRRTSINQLDAKPGTGLPPALPIFRATFSFFDATQRRTAYAVGWGVTIPRGVHGQRTQGPLLQCAQNFPNFAQE